MAWCASRSTIDPSVDRILDKSWPLHRLDATVRAILRAGAYELMFMDKVPAARCHQRICRRGVEPSSASEEPRFVNGVLDRLARDRRPEEFAA